MPKVINCPHCKQAILDDTDDVVKGALEPVRTDLQKLLEGLNALPGKFPQGQPLPVGLTETIQGVAKATQHLEAQAQAYETASKEAKESHPSPPETVAGWEQCPDCGPVWQGIKANIETKAREGYVPIAEAQRVATAVAAQLGRGG